VRSRDKKAPGEMEGEGSNTLSRYFSLVVGNSRIVGGQILVEVVSLKTDSGGGYSRVENLQMVEEKGS